MGTRDKSALTNVASTDSHPDQYRFAAEASSWRTSSRVAESATRLARCNIDSAPPGAARSSRAMAAWPASLIPIKYRAADRPVAVPGAKAWARRRRASSLATLVEAIVTSPVLGSSMTRPIPSPSSHRWASMVT